MINPLRAAQVLIAVAVVSGLGACGKAQPPVAASSLAQTMDQVCEGCHLKFWYPGRVIPALPDQAPEVN